jgi:hypothetical protein
MLRLSPRSASALATAAGCLVAAPAAAQAPAAAPTVVERPSSAQRTLSAPVAYVGLNVWVGAASAAVRAQRRGGSVWRAALAGAAGGAAMALGQRVVGAGPSGLRMAGVQLTALGANVARNAGDGVPILSDLTLPLYPLYVRVRAGTPHPVSVRLSAVAAVGVVAAVARPGAARLDPGESLRMGGPVFRSPASSLDGAGDGACVEHACTMGLHLNGVVMYADGLGAAGQRRSTLRHEAVHLTQFARDGVLFGVPGSDGILAHGGRAGRWASRWLVADLALPILATDVVSELASADPARASLYELEARAMMR